MAILKYIQIREHVLNIISSIHRDLRIHLINTKGNIRMKYITTSISKLTNIKHMTYAYKQSQD